MLAQRNGRSGAFDALARQVFPGARHGAAHARLDLGRTRRHLVGFVLEGLFIAHHHLFKHACGGDARQVRAARGGGQGQGQAHQVVGRVADHRLVKVTDVHIDAALGIPGGPQVASVAVAADPDRRAMGQAPAGVALQPLVELHGAAAHIGVGRTRHLQVSQLDQVGHAGGGARCFHEITQCRCGGRALALGKCFIMFQKKYSALRRHFPQPALERQHRRGLGA